MLAELRRIEHSKSISANAAKNFPTFRAGDSIEVKMVTHLSSTEIDTYRGVVLGMRRNGADSRFLLADVSSSSCVCFMLFVKGILRLSERHRTIRRELYF